MQGMHAEAFRLCRIKCELTLSSLHRSLVSFRSQWIQRIGAQWLASCVGDWRRSASHWHERLNAHLHPMVRSRKLLFLTISSQCTPTLGEATVTRHAGRANGRINNWMSRPRWTDAHNGDTPGQRGTNAEPSQAGSHVS